MQISGNAFLVTGAASGLGAATARALAAAGGLVLAADVQEAAGMALARELGAAARFQRCDVTQEADGAAAVQAAGALGPLRGLVNCAGIVTGERVLGRDGPHSLARFERVIAVNLLGTFNMLRLAAAAMAQLEPSAEGERGVIVNTSSIAAFDGQIGQAAYAASKGAIAALSLPVARDLARSAIRCVAIAPGIFETPVMQALGAELKASLGAQVPFPPRLGRPEEFAQMVLAILANPMLNGTVIRLDGALRMGPR